jgi:hypothetical protein
VPALNLGTCSDSVSFVCELLPLVLELLEELVPVLEAGAAVLLPLTIAAEVPLPPLPPPPEPPVELPLVRAVEEEAGVLDDPLESRLNRSVESLLLVDEVEVVLLGVDEVAVGCVVALDEELLL